MIMIMIMIKFWDSHTPPAIPTRVNHNPGDYIKMGVVQLGVIYDSLATIRNQNGLPVRALTPRQLLLAVLESYLTPSQPEYTKTPPPTGESSYYMV
jgi:hypothetical protein